MFLRSEIAAHREVCVWQHIECTATECGVVTIRRCEMQKHLNEECEIAAQIEYARNSVENTPLQPIAENW